jgi:tRNA G10  N-methylase Trm11
MIKTISFDEQEIIQNILSLHCYNKNIELDPTYSKGNFYKKGLVKPKYKFDIFPQSDDVQKANAESLPLSDESIEVIMFDPPFLATKGSSLKKNDNNNCINKRFGVYPDEKSLHEFYYNALVEFYRLLKKNGTLIFKCQDKVSSQKQYFSHCYVYEKAKEIGFYPKDLFVLLAKNRIVADWQLKNQQHARKFHSYFWVFQKIDKKVCI